MPADDARLVHIHAPADMHDSINEELRAAWSHGLFENYEFVVTEPDVGVVDVDAIADAVADRLADSDTTEDA